MGFLYPRLLAEQARPLYQEYRELTVAELTSRVAVTHESAVYVATGGDRVPESRLKELREGVLDLARRSGFPDDSDNARNAEFDLALAAFLHSESGMVPAEAAARDVWAFLALVLMPDVAFWRYSRPPGDRVLGTDLTRHVFGRLWWRAQLVRAPEDPEPYHALHILGEAAFDQIYARRAALGGSPHLVRAILRVWNAMDLTGLNKRKTLQDFLKRLLRLAPFVLFDGIDERALDDELRAVAQEAVDAQRGSSSTDPASTPSIPAQQSVEATTSRAVESTPQPVRAPDPANRRFTSVEICAGAGGQALGLEDAGFDPVVLIDSKSDACSTLIRNRPGWETVCIDLAQFQPDERPDVMNVDLLSGGLPRVKSVASLSRPEDAEERRVLRIAIDLAWRIGPRAVLFENVPELVEGQEFESDRYWIETTLAQIGLRCSWKVLNASDFGVPQNRRSGFLVALREPWFGAFSWPEPSGFPTPSVGQVLEPSMASRGWSGAETWARNADRVAPALVGGSDRRGGADLGPTGSKKAWAALGVNGNSLGDEPPGPDLSPGEMPKLTVEQAALIQSFPTEWAFVGGKTSRYRQIGHAMPPPLATAVGRSIAAALRS
ncbi:DNA cytosine methyltransferase [Streptomyces pseudogriseolus]|uniref:DNA cytosine methyltransferase n=1 Tax=Streptomyces pseudogriseolus TaxID=36817 RepID=UPI0027E1AB0C|nr:DUF6339 family protein [Streptomyces pseudogriseolus]